MTKNKYNEEFDMDDYGSYESVNSEADINDEETLDFDGDDEVSEMVESVDDMEQTQVSEVETEDDYGEEYGESVEAEDDDYGEEVADTDDDEYGSSEAEGDPILITLVDKKIPGLLEYMRDHGLNTQVVTDNPEYIAEIMMAQYGGCDVLIIDTGMGVFATSEARKQILNIVQQSEGNIHQFFFYTDNAIKTDIQDQLGRRNKKQLTWVKYKTTMLTVAEMLKHCHTYRNDDYEYQEYENLQPDECLERHITLPTDYQLDKQYSVYGLTSKIIREKVVETDEGLLAGFKPNFRVKMKL